MTVKASRGVLVGPNGSTPAFIFWDEANPDDKRVTIDNAQAAFVVALGIKLDKRRVFDASDKIGPEFKVVLNPDVPVTDLEDDGT